MHDAAEYSHACLNACLNACCYRYVQLAAADAAAAAAAPTAAPTAAAAAAAAAAPAAAAADAAAAARNVSQMSSHQALFNPAMDKIGKTLSSLCICCLGQGSDKCGCLLRVRLCFICIHQALTLNVARAVMGVLPAEVRRKKAVPYCRVFFQSPVMESQVARCMASQFPSVLCQVRLIAGQAPKYGMYSKI